MKTLATAIAIAILAAPAMSQAETYVSYPGTAAAFEIRLDEEEADRLLSATCDAGGQVVVRLGATLAIGRGEFEYLTATLSAGTLTAELKGISVQSPDSEMTGGTELLTVLHVDHGAFAILTQPLPITLQATGGEAHRFEPGPAAITALKTFLDTCRNGAG